MIEAPVADFHPLASLRVLDGFMAGGSLPGANSTDRLLYSPVDDVHSALLYVLQSAQRSIFIAMYGFDDQDLADTIRTKLESEGVYVQLTLDSSQAGGIHEKALLAQEGYPNSSVAVGRSEKGAIMHLKTAVVDESVVVHGSTNWSTGGETLQDNELIVRQDPVEAAKVIARLSAIHTHMLAKINPTPTTGDLP